LLFYACIDEVDVGDSERQESLVTIEAVINDDPDQAPYVLVSRSVPFNTNQQPASIAGCQVTVTDNTGGSVQFEERTGGRYEVNRNDFVPVIGRAYTLTVTLPDGTVYESEPQTMPDAPASIEAVVEAETQLVFSEGTNSVSRINGMQSRVQFTKGNTVTPFLRFTVRGTFEVQAPLFDGIPVNANAEPPVLRCWSNDRAPSFFSIIDATRFSPEAVIEEPLIFLEANSRLAFGYSLEVIANSLTPEAYRYYFTLEGQIDRTGTIFDTPPAPLVTNLRCVTNPDEQVLGLFQVSSTVKTRVFIAREDVPFGVPVSFNECFDPDADLRNMQYCFDCSRRAGVTDSSPEFWPN